jgi:hypothetical protein
MAYTDNNRQCLSKKSDNLFCKRHIVMHYISHKQYKTYCSPIFDPNAWLQEPYQSIFEGTNNLTNTSQQELRDLRYSVIRCLDARVAHTYKFYRNNEDQNHAEVRLTLRYLSQLIADQMIEPDKIEELPNGVNDQHSFQQISPSERKQLKVDATRLMRKKQQRNKMKRITTKQNEKMKQIQNNKQQQMEEKKAIDSMIQTNKKISLERFAEGYVYLFSQMVPDIDDFVSNLVNKDLDKVRPEYYIAARILALLLFDLEGDITKIPQSIIPLDNMMYIYSKILKKLQFKESELDVQRDIVESVLKSRLFTASLIEEIYLDYPIDLYTEDHQFLIVHWIHNIILCGSENNFNEVFQRSLNIITRAVNITKELIQQFLDICHPVKNSDAQDISYLFDSVNNTVILTYLQSIIPSLKRKLSNGLQINVCSLCDQPGANLRKCARCRIAKYCSKECQKTHWNSHRSYCKKP